MDLIINGLATIILIVSAITFFSMQWNISTTLSLKKVIIGGVLSATAFASILILAKAPFDERFVLAIVCMSTLGITVISIRWISDKIFTRFNKYTSVNIQNVILTDSVNEAGIPIRRIFKFRQTDRKIYCFITHMSLTGAYLGATLLVKWHYEGQEIHHSTHRLQANHPILAEISVPEDDVFRQGRYNVELFIGYTADRLRVKTVEFEVI